MQWHTQAGNITANIKVAVGFTLPGLSSAYVVTWNCHVDESTKGRYDMITRRDILTSLGLNLTLSDHAIESDYLAFKASTETTVDLGTYEFKYLNIGKITPEESFIISYIEYIYELEQVRIATKRLRAILYAKHEKEC